MVIEQGNGSWQLYLSKQRCPRCYSLLTRRGEDISKVRYECIVCKLTVIDVKGSDDETS